MEGKWKDTDAGTHPLNINNAPSFLKELLITFRVDYI